MTVKKHPETTSFYLNTFLIILFCVAVLFSTNLQFLPLFSLPFIFSYVILIDRSLFKLVTFYLVTVFIAGLLTLVTLSKSVDLLIKISYAILFLCLAIKVIYPNQAIKLIDLIKYFKLYIKFVRIHLSYFGLVSKIPEKSFNVARYPYSLINPYVAAVTKTIAKFFRKYQLSLITLIPIYLTIKLLFMHARYYRFYQSFFITNQLIQYYEITGKWLLVFGLIHLIACLFVFTQFITSKKYHRLIASLTLILFSFLFVSKKIFDSTTTPFRDKTTIMKISPNKATLWDEVALVGRNFQNAPFPGEVLINGVPHRIIHWDDQKVVFQAEPGKSRTGKLQLITNSGQESNEIEFIYYDLTTGQNIK